MQRTRRDVIIGSAASLTAATFAGCLGDDDSDDDRDDDHSHDDDHDDNDHGDHDHMDIGEFEVIDRSEDDVAAYVHGDHWHGGLPEVPVDDNISLGAYIEDGHGDEIALGSDEEFELRVRVADDAPEGVVEFDSHGDHVHVIGEEEGITDVVFQLWHDDHADYETPEITVQVVGDDHDHDHDHDDHDHDHGASVHELEIIDRSTDEVVADAHDDHWHGELPEVPVDDNVSLGARFLDDHDDEIPIGSGQEYEFRVRLVDGAEEIVEFDSHGDHVHIIGEEAGETAVVFQLWHDDHADYESPPIEVTVADDDY